MKSTTARLLATAALMMSVLPSATPRKGGNRDYKPNPPRLDSTTAREIQEHNAEVDRRKAKKRAAKAAKKWAAT
jgi:hypothetical protein